MNSKDIEWIQSVFHARDMFEAMSAQEKSDLIDHMDRINFAAGDTVIEKGKPGDWFFLVREGRVEVRKKGLLGREKVIAQLGTSDWFGEIALMSNHERTATLVAVEPTVCFVMFKTKFENLVEKYPGFKEGVEDLIKKRMAK